MTGWQLTTRFVFAVLFDLEGVFISGDHRASHVVFNRHLHIVKARFEILERDQPRQRDLLAVDRAQTALAVFLNAHHFLVFTRNDIFDVHAGPQRRLVNRHVVNLHVNAHRLIFLEFAGRIRHDFQRTKHKLAAWQTPGRC